MTYILVKKNKIKQDGSNYPFIIDEITLCKSRLGGYGVFSNRDILQDEIIEISPFLILPNSEISSNNPISDYIFKYDNNKSCFVLGYGSMYNHSDNPNIEYYFNDDKTFFMYKATRNIEKNEELCISYGDQYWSSRNIKKII